MKNKVLYLSLIAVACITASCGMTYYATSVYDDGIYYRTNPATRLQAIAEAQAQIDYERQVDASYFTTDSLGNVVLAEGVSYEDLLHRFDNPTYEYKLDYNGWYGNYYNPFYGYYGINSWRSPWRYSWYSWNDPWYFNSWYDPWYYDYAWYGGWYDPWYYGWGGHIHHHYYDWPHHHHHSHNYPHNPNGSYYGRRNGGSATVPGSGMTQRRGSYVNPGSYSSSSARRNSTYGTPATTYETRSSGNYRTTTNRTGNSSGSYNNEGGRRSSSYSSPSDSRSSGSSSYNSSSRSESRSESRSSSSSSSSSYSGGGSRSSSYSGGGFSGSSSHSGGSFGGGSSSGGHSGGGRR